MTHYILCITALCVFAQPGRLLAQERSPIAIEAILGATRGYSDNSEGYRGSRNGIFGEILVGVRLHAPDRAGAFVALDAGVHGLNIVWDADCRIAPDGGCIPWFPGFGAVSLLGGWESRSTAFRLVGGPGIVSSDSDKAFGIVARLDAALPLVWHTAVLATISTLVVPSWNGDRFYYIAVGAGLRVR